MSPQPCCAPPPASASRPSESSLTRLTQSHCRSKEDRHRTCPLVAGRTRASRVRQRPLSVVCSSPARTDRKYARLVTTGRVRGPLSRAELDRASAARARHRPTCSSLLAQHRLMSRLFALALATVLVLAQPVTAAFTCHVSSPLPRFSPSPPLESLADSLAPRSGPFLIAGRGVPPDLWPARAQPLLRARRALRRRHRRRPALQQAGPLAAAGQQHGLRGERAHVQQPDRVRLDLVHGSWGRQWRHVALPLLLLRGDDRLRR